MSFSPSYSMHRDERINATSHHATERLCQEIESLLQQTLERAERRRRTLGEYDYETDSNAFFIVIARHAEAFLILARTHPALLSSAALCARAAFEAHARLMWLIQPHDPYEREARSIRLIRHDAREYEKLAHDRDSPDLIRSYASDIAHQYNDYASRVSDAIHNISDYDTGASLPRMPGLLESCDSKQHYAYYRLLSAFVHSSRQSTAGFRRYLGANTEFGQFVDPADWLLAFEVVWGSLFRASCVILALVDAPLQADEKNSLTQRWRQLAAGLSSGGNP
jgi:hypothetical protein